MDYWEDVRKVAQAHREEIEGDLDRARIELRRVQGDVQAAQRRVEAYQQLLELADSGESPSAPTEELTLHEAMAQVLRAAPEGMLRAGELAAEINRQRLYRMRDGRPVEPQQVHARVGHYGRLFTREGTFIKLKDS